MKEITRQKDAGLLAVAQTLNRDGEGPALGANAADALKMLEQQGRVVEIPERGRLMQGAVDRYFEESAMTSPKGRPQSVLMSPRSTATAASSTKGYGRPASKGGSLARG